MNDIQRIAEQQRRLINDLARTLPLEALYNMNEPLRALASSAQAATQAAGSALKAIDPTYVTQSFAALAATRARLQQIPEVMLGGANAVARNQFPAIEAMHPKIMDLLPNISQLVVQAKELRQAQEALESAGLDALVRPLPFYLLQGLGGVDARVRPAWLINRLLQFSRTDDFASEIESTFFHSMVLRDRWPLVEEAILMHREGRYLLSIPPLLAQTEGVVGDALVLKGIVRPLKGKLYVKDDHGSRQRNRKGDYVTISGASDLAACAKKLDHETLNSVASYLTTVFIGSRNPILHGRKPKYRSPKLSVQSIFVLYMLSGAIREFEKSG